MIAASSLAKISVIGGTLINGEPVFGVGDLIGPPKLGAPQRVRYDPLDIGHPIDSEAVGFGALRQEAAAVQHRADLGLPKNVPCRLPYPLSRNVDGCFIVPTQHL